ncbi:hypothetical protein [Streptomyces sp. NPDC059389]|uniref:hypothetical protein n=1 Tax=Streptomyces sp. NPDC059389 TaxID=3346818 RepID=UPI0036CE4A4B
MEKVGTVPVTACLPFGTRRILCDLLTRERQRRIRLMSDDRWLTGRSDCRETPAEVRAVKLRALADIRARGDLLDTLDRLAALGVRRELEARGWNRLWPPHPEPACFPGRWPGSRDRDFPERICLRLPVTLEGQVRAACWFTSADAIAAIRVWRERYPRVRTRRRRTPAGMENALVEYDRLAAIVTTTGDIWRAGVQQAIEFATSGGAQQPIAFPQGDAGA